MKPSSILTNKVVFYLVSRYFTYFIQFVTSLVIAVKLGPYYMGIWGFILLLINYFQQLHFGIANSLNILLVHHKDSRKECDNYIANSLVLVGGLSFLVLLFAVYYYYVGISSFEKYHISDYMTWICAIAILQYFNMIFVNIFRIKNKLLQVAFNQSVIVFLNFSCVFFFTGERLIYCLVAGYLVGNIVCILSAAFDRIIPLPRDVSITKNYLREVLKKGFFLFLYNSCFYFIIISIRTIISYYYPVREFGLFTFSFSLAHAILLLLEAFAFIIFPKIIHKLSSEDLSEVNDTLTQLRRTYISSAHLLVYIALCCFPLLIHFFPKYEDAWQVFNLISLSILMNTNSFGYSTLLIARNKEKYTALVSFIALVVNIVLGCVLVVFLKVSFSYVILSTLVTYLFFSSACIIIGKKLLGRFPLVDILKESFPVRLWLPYLAALGIAVFARQSWIFIPLFLYIACNHKDIGVIYGMIKKILVRPNVVNI